MRVTLRGRRQLTLPRDVCEALKVRPGDWLNLELVEGALLVRPSKKVALDAIRAIQHALEEAGVTEEELLESGRRIREEMVREKWPHLFPPDEKQR